MRGKVWAFGGAGVVMIVVALVEQHAAAQASRPQVPLFEPDPLWSQVLPNKWVTGQVGGLAADSKGNLFIGEVNNGQRYYRYAFKGMGSAR